MISVPFYHKTLGGKYSDLSSERQHNFVSEEPNIAKVSEHERIWNCNPLRGLVDRVPRYRSRGPGFDSRLYQIF
jgi:hypothetical protein